jgi:hypothetical protein
MDLYRRIGLTSTALIILVVLGVGVAWIFGTAADAGLPPCVPATQEAAGLRALFPGIYALDVCAIAGGALCYWLALQQQWFLGHKRVRWLTAWGIASFVSIALVLALYEFASPCMQEAVWGIQGLALPPYSSNALPFIGGFWSGRAIDLAFFSAAGISCCHWLRTRALLTRQDDLN